MSSESEPAKSDSIATDIEDTTFMSVSASLITAHTEDGGKQTATRPYQASFLYRLPGVPPWFPVVSTSTPASEAGSGGNP